MFTLESLRDLAREFCADVNHDVHKFIDFIEGKHGEPEQTVGELQAAEAGAAPQAEQPAPPPELPADPAAPPAEAQ